MLLEGWVILVLGGKVDASEADAAGVIRLEGAQHKVPVKVNVRRLLADVLQLQRAHNLSNKVGSPNAQSQLLAVGNAVES